MSKPSQWPLPPKGSRLVTPRFIVKALADNPLSRDCLPSAMGYYPQAKDHFMARDMPDDDLVIFCVAGIGSVEVGGVRHRVQRGDAVLLPAGRAHSYNADKNDPWTIFWVHVCGELSDPMMHHLGSPDDVVIHPGLSPRLIAGFEQLLEVGQTGYNESRYIASCAHLKHLLIMMADLDAQQRRHSQQEFDLLAIQDYMRAKLSGRITLEELARYSDISKSHLVERYKALTGYPPVKHFTHMKMEAACALLDSSSQSIKQVAVVLGYDDPLYFSRLFKKVVGVSPSVYRAARVS